MLIETAGRENMLLSRTAEFRKLSSSVSISIREGELVLRTLSRKSDMEKAFRLRHRIFSEELRWVAPSSDAQERDDYDNGAVFFGVFDRHNRLMAFLRLIRSENTFMLEGEFPYLLGKEVVLRKGKDAAEISRLCVDPEARTNRISGNFGVHYVSMLLYKGVYQCCLRIGIRYLYLVVDRKIYRLLCAKGFPCVALKEPKEMEDGVLAIAAVLDWRDFEVSCLRRRPEMLRWFTRCQSDRL
jgi:N-acyl-L-homoserine lactone synthetase